MSNRLYPLTFLLLFFLISLFAPTSYTNQELLVGIWIDEGPYYNEGVAFYPDGLVAFGLYEGDLRGNYNATDNRLTLNLTSSYGQRSSYSIEADYSVNATELTLTFHYDDGTTGTTYYRRIGNITSENQNRCPGTLPDIVFEGYLGQISYLDGTRTRLRSEPSFNSNTVTYMSDGTWVYITGAPVCAENTTFWPIEVKDTHQRGFVTEGDQQTGHYYLELVAFPYQGYHYQDFVPYTEPEVITFEEELTIPIGLDIPEEVDESFFDQIMGLVVPDVYAFEATTRLTCTALIDERREDLDLWHTQGNAHTFDDSACRSTAQNLGVTASPGNVEFAEVGDIVVWNQDCGSVYETYGHVGIISGVNTQSNTIFVDERNYDGYGNERSNHPHTVDPCMSFIHRPLTNADNSLCVTEAPEGTSSENSSAPLPSAPTTTNSSNNTCSQYKAFRWLFCLLGIRW